MKEFPNVVNPKLWVEPKNMTPAQLQRYVSVDQLKIAQSMRNYKRSVFYIGGILAACLVSKFFVDKAVQQYVYGENGNGGIMLKMYTRNSAHDYTYNRQFQRFRYLNEEPAGMDSSLKSSDKLLHDLGVRLPQSGLQCVPKKVPHDKYLI